MREKEGLGEGGGEEGWGGRPGRGAGEEEGLMQAEEGVVEGVGGGGMGEGGTRAGGRRGTMSKNICSTGKRLISSATTVSVCSCDSS